MKSTDNRAQRHEDSESECYAVTDTNHSMFKNARRTMTFIELPSQTEAENK